MNNTQLGYEIKKGISQFYTERERERERQTDRQTDRQTETERETERERERETTRGRNKDTHTHTQHTSAVTEESGYFHGALRVNGDTTC